jgi:hypothetical protein
MANANRVGAETQDGFGNKRLARITAPFSLGTTANAVVALPILSGGGGGTTEYIIRRIVIANLSNSTGNSSVPSAALANVTVGTTNDGGNLVANTTTLTNLTNGLSYVDLTLSTDTLKVCYTANVLFVNVTANVANAQAFISVYGDVVTF